jgi:hypothetical protein
MYCFLKNCFLKNEILLYHINTSTMHHKQGGIFDGNFSYALYETKSAPAGMKHSRWTTKRDPLNPTPPDMPSIPANIRERERTRAIQHMQPYNHVSYAIELIRGHTDKSPNKITNHIKLNLNDSAQFGPLLNKHLKKESPRLSEDDSESPNDISITDESDSDGGDRQVRQLTEPLFDSLPDNIFATINAVKYVSLEATLDAAICFTKNKIVVFRNAENIKAKNINHWDKVNHLSFQEADRLFKMILCEISGQNYTAERLERATYRLMYEIYGVEIMPVFIMLIFHLIDLSLKARQLTH